MWAFTLSGFDLYGVPIRGFTPPPVILPAFQAFNIRFRVRFIWWTYLYGDVTMYVLKGLKVRKTTDGGGTPVNETEGIFRKSPDGATGYVGFHPFRV